MSNDASTSEAPEIRDAAEMHEEAVRNMAANVPVGVDGRPMALISMTVSDKVPTVQFGNVVVGPVTITRYIDDLGDDLSGRQHRIDRARELQRDAEFVCGIERRLVQWAVDPSSRIQSPVDAQDAFAAPPVGYDPTQATDPRGVPLTPPPAPAPTPAQETGAPPQVQPVTSGVQLG